MPSPAPARAGLVRLARRNFAYVAAFVMDISMASGVLAGAYWAKEEFGASPAQLGLFALFTAGAYVLASLFFGKLADRWGRRRNIFLACAICTTSFALILHATRLWHLYALMTTFAIGQGAFWPALEADISDNSTPRELPVRIGRFNVAWCSGFAVASLGAGVLGQICGLLPVMALAAAGVMLALVVYLLRTFEPESFPAREPDECAVRRAATRAGTFWKMALILNFAVMGLNGALRYHMPSVTGQGRSALGGAYLTTLFTAEVLTFIVLARWHGWHHRAAPMAVGACLAMAGGVICGLSSAPMLFGAGCVLIGVGCGIIYYSSIYYSISAATDRGHRGGIHEAVLGLGAAVIPYLGGVLVAVPWAGGLLSWPDGTPFLTAVAVLLLASALCAAIYLRVRSAPASRPR